MSVRRAQDILTAQRIEAFVADDALDVERQFEIGFQARLAAAQMRFHMLCNLLLAHLLTRQAQQAHMVGIDDQQKIRAITQGAEKQAFSMQLVAQGNPGFSG